MHSQQQNHEGIANMILVGFACNTRELLKFTIASLQKAKTHETLRSSLEINTPFYSFKIIFASLFIFYC